MQFYHCFYTDLPDQFVEANHRALIRWATIWIKNHHPRKHSIIDNVPIAIFKNYDKHYPTFIANSQVMINDWLFKKGTRYNGRYWESLAEDQRSPAAPAVVRTKIPAATWRTFNAGQVNPIPSSPSQGGLSLAQAVQNIAIWRTIPMVLLDEPSARPPLKRESIIAGEIIGYRCWRIERGLLRSVWQSDFWHPGTILEGREIEDWGHRGVHAWKDPAGEHYHDYIREYLNSPKSLSAGENLRPAMATGSIYLWGDVVEHERGWRGEFASVRSLDWLYPDADMMGREREVLDNLREKYGVRDDQR